MEVRGRHIQRKSIFKDEKIDQIYKEYYEFNKNIKIEKIEKDLENIDLIITRDFAIIKAYTEYKEREILKLQFERMLFSLIGIRKKAAEKYIQNNIKLEILLKDREEYFEHFALELNLEELQNRLINSFKLYNEIITSKFYYKKYIIELYTIYKTMLASIMHMLPQPYREDLFKIEPFNQLKNDLNNLECYDDFTTSNQMVYDIKKFDNILKEYLNSKFNVDLYDYSLTRKRN